MSFLVNPDGFGENGWRRRKHIENISELLCAMSPSHWGTSAELKFGLKSGHHNKRDQESARVVLTRDCNYYMDSSSYDVYGDVAERAIMNGFVEGVKKLGYTSTFEWVVTNEGQKVANEARRQFMERERIAAPPPKSLEDHDPGDESTR